MPEIPDFFFQNGKVASLVMTKNFFLHVARPSALLAMGRYPSLKLSIAQYRVDLDLFTNYITYTVTHS